MKLTQVLNDSLHFQFKNEKEKNNFFLTAALWLYSCNSSRETLYNHLMWCKAVNLTEIFLFSW